MQTQYFLKKKKKILPQKTMHMHVSVCKRQQNRERQ